MARVVEGVETDDIRVEEAAEHQVPVGERAEHLRGGERRVQEKPAAHGVEALAQKRRQEHEVVIVHPHEVAVGVEHLHHLVRESLVRGEVPLPVGLVVPRGALRGHREHVVHERPEELLAESFVVLRLELFAQEHRDAVEALGDVRGDRVLLEELHLAAEAAQEDHLLHGRAGQDARAALPVDGVGVALEVPAVPPRGGTLGVVSHLERQRVAHDDHPLRIIHGISLLRLERSDAGMHGVFASGIHQLLEVVHRRRRRAPHGDRPRKRFSFGATPEWTTGGTRGALSDAPRRARRRRVGSRRAVPIATGGA